MAKIVAALPEAVEFRGRPEEYPWDAWLNGQIWQLQPRIDFYPKPDSFRSTIKAAADRRALRVTCRKFEGDLYVQAFAVPGDRQGRRHSPLLTDQIAES